MLANTLRRRFLWLAVALLLLACFDSHAAYISEIDQGGPAGRGIELSQVDSASDYTLVFIDANAQVLSRFGAVVDVMHLQAGSGYGGVAMVTDSAWPGEPTRTLPLSSVSLASGDSTLNFNLSRLLIVMQGDIDVRRYDRPVTDALASARFDPTAVTDWLVLGSGDLATAYQSNGYDIAGINAALGIDLLTRLADKDAGRVIARTNLPGQPIDMDQVFIGDPDVTQAFAVDADHNYAYTPGEANLPLINHTPEPGSLSLLAMGLAALTRRATPRRP